VVLRGVNEMVTYINTDNDVSAAFGEIARTNANAVRLYWRLSDSASRLGQVLSLAEAETHPLLAIIYVFKDDDPAQEPGTTPTSLDDATKYWTSDDVKAVIKQHQSWLIVALRDKNTDTAADVATWAQRYDAAVKSMRDAGIAVPLAIDAPLAGSDVESLLSLGRARIKADPLHNLLLNVNAGFLSDSSATLARQLSTAYKANLPLLIGEVSGRVHTAKYECDGDYTYSTVLAAAQQTETGWLAWSWGWANNQYCSQLNMTADKTYEGLTAWGLDAAVKNENSIANTSTLPTYVPGSSCAAGNHDQ